MRFARRLAGRLSLILREVPVVRSPEVERPRGATGRPPLPILWPAHGRRRGSARRRLRRVDFRFCGLLVPVHAGARLQRLRSDAA